MVTVSRSWIQDQIQDMSKFYTELILRSYLLENLFHFRVYLGLFKRDQLNDGYKYTIESVRIPAERIQMYKSAALAGPWDIALIKLSKYVTFIPHKVAPVSK